MPVEASRAIRKMRGGAQAWLVEAGEGDYYVVKFLENAQHRRILVNEWLAGAFLDHLGLCIPRTALVTLKPEWLASAEGDGMSIQFGDDRRSISPGFHFGSRVPVDPNTTALYDYLPDQILRTVHNRSHFHGMLAFDQWVCNADTRQSIYFRARLSQYIPEVPAASTKVGFVAMMIDHGYAFHGPEWRLDDLPRQGMCPRPAAYEEIESWESFEPWLSRMMHFPEHVMDRALCEIPSSWLEKHEEGELHRLLEALLRRRRRIPELIEASRRSRPEYFANWTTVVSFHGPSPSAHLSVRP